MDAQLEVVRDDARPPVTRPPATGPVCTRYSPREPVSLRQTLGQLGRGPRDPTTIWDAAGCWRSFRTPDGPVTVRLTRAASGIDVTAWGAGAEWAIAGIPELLGVADDWSGLEIGDHPLLRDALHRNPGIRLAKTRLVLEALVPAIIEQRVTCVEAYRSWARLVRAHGEPAPGPAPAALRVVPSPQQWRRIPSWEWHRAGVDPRRSRAVVAAAAVASGLERTLAPGLTGGEVALRLTSVAGVGVWTAAETAQRSHGDPDAVSVGDYHLASFVGLALIGKKVDDDGMLELLEPWAGQRQRIVRLILASGYRAERHGPRASIQDHRWH